MAYTAFTDNKVFNDNRINVVANTLYNAAIEEFPALSVSSLLCVTGTTAKVIQDAVVADAPNLAFITSRKTIIDYFFANAKTLFKPDEITRLKNTLQFKKDGFCYEIHYDGTLSLILEVSGVYVQDDSEIPSNIL